MELHAFVLHLTRATARRENAHVLKDACITAGVFSVVDIWPAVDGAAVSSRDLSACVGTHLFRPSYPFGLKTGEIGCFLSHRQIWAEMQIREIDAALIIEDDAGLNPEEFATSLSLAVQNVDALGYIQFQTRRTIGPATVVDANGSCRLTVPHVAGLRTTAQMVSKAAAAHLLTKSEAFDRPVDTFVQSHWHTGLRPATIHPSGVSDIADTLDGSTIQTSRKSGFEKLTRTVHRSRYRRAVNGLSRRSTAPREGGLAHG